MKKCNKVKKFRFILVFLIFEMFYFAITSPFVIFYGPFENLKSLMVGGFMITSRFQFVPKFFLSEAKIKEILGKNKVEAKEHTNLPAKEVKKEYSNSIAIEKIQSNKNFIGYMMIISDPKRVRVGYSGDFNVKSIKTSQLAKRYNAIAAINGGGFNYNDNLYQPLGIVISGGTEKFNGIGNEDSSTDIMGFTKDGQLVVGSYSLRELRKMNLKEAICFGPALVINGKGTVASGDGGQGLNPRTAIGQKEDGTVLMLVVDGRKDGLGATLKDLQDIMLSYGAINATNLDGGGSSTMYYDTKIINNPSDILGERVVPTIVYVK